MSASSNVPSGGDGRESWDGSGASKCTRDTFRFSALIILRLVGWCHRVPHSLWFPIKVCVARVRSPDGKQITRKPCNVLLKQAGPSLQAAIREEFRIRS